MSTHTIGSLMDILEGFPRDLEIANDIAIYWFYPDSLKEYEERMQPEDYRRLTQSEAYDVCIFEGSWEKGDVVDHEDMMRQLLEKYAEEPYTQHKKIK